MLLLTLCLWTHVLALFCWHSQIVCLQAIWVGTFTIMLIFMLVMVIFSHESKCSKISITLFGDVIGLCFHNKSISLLLLSVYQFCVCMFCIVALWNCFEVEPHCNELSVRPFELIFETSQSLALVGQPPRIGHVWRIIRGHSTFRPTTCWFIIHIWYMKMTNHNLWEWLKGTEFWPIRNLYSFLKDWRSPWNCSSEEHLQLHY